MSRLLTILVCLFVAFLVVKALVVAAVFCAFVVILGVLGMFAPIARRLSGGHKHMSSPLVDPLNGFREIR